MVRVFSLVALAAAAVVVAVAPAAAMPALSLRAATAAAFVAPADAAVADLGGLTMVHQLERKMDPLAMVKRALRPAWKTFKAGKLDAKIADFKAGKYDMYWPTPKEVKREAEMVAMAIKDLIPKVFKLLDEVKAGKHDADLAAAKKGNLEDFLMWVCDKLYPKRM